VRGCVFEYIHTFLNIKRNNVFNEEISRNLIFIKRYQGKETGKKRENEGERVRQRERRRERERERECVV